MPHSFSWKRRLNPLSPPFRCNSLAEYVEEGTGVPRPLMASVLGLLPLGLEVRCVAYLAEAFGWGSPGEPRQSRLTARHCTCFFSSQGTGARDTAEVLPRPSGADLLLSM